LFFFDSLFLFICIVFESILKMPIFWGQKINVGESKAVEVMEGQAITVGQVSLTNATANVRYILSIKLEDEEFVLATLSKDKQDQCLQDFNLFPETPVELSLRTEDRSVDHAQVHLIGYIQMMEDEEGESDEEFDDEAYQERLVAQMNNGHFHPSSSESEEEQEEEAPMLVAPLKSQLKRPIEDSQPPTKKAKKAENHNPTEHKKAVEKKETPVKTPTATAKKETPAKKETTPAKTSTKVEQKKTAESGTSANRCTICSRDFKNPEGLGAHNAAKHKS